MFSFDTETYRNYFLFASKNCETKESFIVETQSRLSVEQCERLRRHLRSGEFFAFNNQRYDDCIISFALTGASVRELKELSDCIILRDMPPWKAEREFGFDIISQERWNRWDIKALCPLKESLKTYGARLGVERLQSLPVDPDKKLTPEEIALTRDYCLNGDIEAAIAIWAEPQIQSEYAIREKLSRDYDLDFRSFNTPKLAETIMIQEVCKLDGRDPSDLGKPNSYTHASYHDHLKHISPYFCEILADMYDKVVNHRFELKRETGSPVLPPFLSKFEFYGKEYKIGLGGLHSVDSHEHYKSGDGKELLDIDVASFYPNLGINLGLYPRKLGSGTVAVYRRLTQRRLAKKKELGRLNDRKTMEYKRLEAEVNGLKLVINSFFGKTGSLFSQVYDPNYLLGITISGQFALLWLIQLFGEEGIPVVSANTDGVVVHCDTGDIELVDEVIKKWEKALSLELEKTEYTAIYINSVNSYFAVKKGGKGIKRKGGYCVADLGHNPAAQVIPNAVAAFLSEGKPIYEFIRECDKMQDFLYVRKMTGGCLVNGADIGKTVRYYRSLLPADPIISARPNKAGAYVRPSMSDNCKLLMTLPEGDINDVDKDWYIKKAYEVLFDIDVLDAEFFRISTSRKVEIADNKYCAKFREWVHGGRPHK